MDFVLHFYCKMFCIDEQESLQLLKEFEGLETMSSVISYVIHLGNESFEENDGQVG